MNPSETTAIDTADHVLHRPSGETWLVAYVRGDRLSACGWPDTMAAIADCDLVKKASQAERLELLRSMAKGEGHRASHARDALSKDPT